MSVMTFTIVFVVNNNNNNNNIYNYNCDPKWINIITT